MEDPEYEYDELIFFNKYAGREDLFDEFQSALDVVEMSDRERLIYSCINADMPDQYAAGSLKILSLFLYRYYGKKIIILLDEYDTPMQEAYLNGYWEEFTGFVRQFFNSTFKTNPYMYRAVMTGITRISKESIFSDLNNISVITTTSEEYADCFGFTELEVFSALDLAGLSDMKEKVKAWYDAELMSENITTTQIYHYGFAFDGKNVLIKCKST